MSKPKELDNILDECLDRLMVKGETLEECLRHYPAYADELRPLLEAALVTSRLSLLEPGPEFRDKARVQFYKTLKEMESKKTNVMQRLKSIFRKKNNQLTDHNLDPVDLCCWFWKLITSYHNFRNEWARRPLKKLLTGL